MKTIKVSEFKARLSSFLRRVRAGEKFTILDRNQPIAVVSEVASEDFEVKDGTESFHKFIQQILKQESFSKPQRSLQLLKDERARR